MLEFDVNQCKWINPPDQFIAENDKVEIITKPFSDLWQRTAYGFRNDNGHIMYQSIEEKAFSLVVKTSFESCTLYDQCGIVIYQNSENWVKVCVEYGNPSHSWLGSVVTHHGFSDWATSDIDSSVKTMWYRVSRRSSDFLFENSVDGISFKQMRLFHLFEAEETVRIGFLACSPKDSSFKAVFTDFRIVPCTWDLKE
jgi:regulation of enolase protein 1 (concanavalin A-like superfamily)